MTRLLPLLVLLLTACTPDAPARTSGSGNPPAAAGTQWLTDHAAASQRSRELGRPILADFTGSDWCTWCIKLDDEVFETPAFREWAARNVVLLKLDFPRGKQLDPELQRQNRGLARKYQVRGFPTILFLDGGGAVLGQMGYLRGGPSAWTQKANQIIAAAK